LLERAPFYKFQPGASYNLNLPLLSLLIFSGCWQVCLRWPESLLQLRSPSWLKHLVMLQVHNFIFLNYFLLDCTNNAYNQRGFSNVTYTTVSLPRQILTAMLPTMHFAKVG